MVIGFIFISQQGFIHEIIGSVVRYTTHSRFSHVAIGFEDFIIEAVAPKVKVSEVTKFDGEIQRVILSYNVSDEVYDKCLATAKNYIGTAYGLDDCLIGGLRDFFDVDASALDINDTTDCSALGVIVARVVFPDLLSNTQPCEVTPERLYRALKEL